MIIKKKSLVVALVSSVVITLVMVITLVGYVAYIELKGEEFRHSYQGSLQKINARAYEKNVSITGLDAKIETSGALKGKPVVEGVIKNNGNRNISGILIKVKFLDKDGATVYESVFYPQEPSLGSANLAQLNIPYLSTPPKITLGSGKGLPFKKIITNAPLEILAELRGARNSVGNAKKWSGKFDSEVLSIDFSD